MIGRSIDQRLFVVIVDRIAGRLVIVVAASVVVYTQTDFVSIALANDCVIAESLTGVTGQEDEKRHEKSEEYGRCDKKEIRIINGQEGGEVQ